MKIIKIFPFVLLFAITGTIQGQAVLTDEVMVSDGALYFNGEQITDTQNYQDKPGYDFVFGRQISPHGDCIDFYGKYVFLTWYKGGEENRHVMLSRYDTETGNLATIQFEHRHTGFQNNPNLGESHNTIAVGISPLDSTIHLLYDMHAYSENRPADGSLANDYFRYQYSVPDAVSVPDAEFTAALFSPKQLFLKQGDDYKNLTYPDFFLNLNNELMVKMRRGGSTGGKFIFAKYNPQEGWNSWTDFDVTAWGLYGSIKYQAGKMRIGFSTRFPNTTDKYLYNNGFYYAYSNDPSGKTQWFNAQGQPFNLPLTDPEFIKISEPGDEVPETGVDQVRMVGDADWSVNDREDIHFVTRVNSTNVHTYRQANESEFSTSTDFPGGELIGYGNNMYLVGLESGKPVIHRANGGTNDWVEVYRQEGGRNYRLSVSRIKDGILYNYLMEDPGGQTSDANPIYLLTYDLNDDVPVVGFTNLEDNEILAKGTDLTVRGTTNDPYNDLSLYVNDQLVSTLSAPPYSWSDHPLLNDLNDPSYTLKLVASTSTGDEIEKILNITTAGQTPYTLDQLPHPVPGAILFAHYDEGGENISYWDRTEQDPGTYTYRGTDKVDLNADGTRVLDVKGSSILGYEWLEYTVDVTQTGFYDLEVTHETGRSGDFEALNVSLPDEEISLVENFVLTQRETPGVPLTDLMGNVLLTQGEHVIRFTTLSFGFILDNFELTYTGPAILVTFNDGTNTTEVYANEDGTVNLPPDPKSSVPGETFVGWFTADDEPFDENSVVTEDTEVYAQFELIVFQVTTSAVNGTVSIEPEMSEYPNGMAISLTAIPNEGYKFSAWSGDSERTRNPLQVIVDKDLSIQANFVPVYTIHTTSENGAVMVSPDQDEYDLGTEVTLTATPNTGYEFMGWSGDVNTTQNPIVIVMNKNMSFMATFAAPLSTIDDIERIRVYPNPADDRLTIEGASIGSTLSILSMDGSLVKKVKVEHAKTKVDLTQFQSGIYLISTDEQNDKKFRKIIIK